MSPLIQPLERYITKIERLNPSQASHEVVTNLDSLVRNTLLDATNLSEDIEDTIMSLVDRFWRWTRRKILTTAEAALFHSKSRSTIYRWIKSGKLNAEKVNNKWQVIL